MTSLSDFIRPTQECGERALEMTHAIRVDKIRKSIKELKEYFNDMRFPSCAVEISDEIDKIFGEELTK